VDVIEELVRFTILLRPHSEQLVDRYSERKDRNEPVDTPVESAGLTAAPGSV
jgi:arsenic resistance protein ArsH